MAWYTIYMKTIKIETTISAPIEKVWEYWSTPVHITNWAFASDDWECPHAENDLREGGAFLTRMSAKDGSATFDIIGTYTAVIPHEKIAYTMSDGRIVITSFETSADGAVKVMQEFEMEGENSEELQRNGWQAILDNFKKYTEQN